MKKYFVILSALILIAFPFAGCAKQPEQIDSPDTISSASIVSEEVALITALGPEGTWIIATLNDLELAEEIIVEGHFHNKDDETQDVYRKLGLYTQDDEHNIIEQFILTAPKMIVKSENFRIQGGTFIGDVYVQAHGFNVGKAATVDGNIYFASQEYMDSFYIHELGTVTGTTAVE